MKSLAMCKEGSEVNISMVNCGFALKTKLCDMGLYANTKVKIMKNDLTGPIIVQVKESRIVIGRGQANQIMIKS